MTHEGKEQAMEKTPAGLRRHVVLAGRPNAGKSTLFNALAGQNSAIVSEKPGTTTDPVKKAMELHPFGPIVLVDTAGLGDESELGPLRAGKTHLALRRADAALFVASVGDFNEAEYRAFAQSGTDHLLVFTEAGPAAPGAVQGLKKRFPQAVFWRQGESVEALRQRLAALLAAQTPQMQRPLLADLVPPGGTVLLVTPVDSGAPKGRMILPQVQALRDCLDSGLVAAVCREHELQKALAALGGIDLVVTDSQVFATVARGLPPTLPLTSFSMLQARQKGGFGQLLEGAQAIGGLKDGARILMLEGCTHNHTHEDIGRVKLPAALQKRAGRHFVFDHYSGYDFPQSLFGYSLAIQCGGCMLNSREIAWRLGTMEKAGLPVTNYGMALAWAAGILERATAVFAKGAQP